MSFIPVNRIIECAKAPVPMFVNFGSDNGGFQEYNSLHHFSLIDDLLLRLLCELVQVDDINSRY